MTAPRMVRAPRGPARTCKGWVQEAALRMLMNNLDPEVAERPQDLVVYGGTGKAARDWPAFDAICRTLLTLGDDETLRSEEHTPELQSRLHIVCRLLLEKKKTHYQIRMATRRLGRRQA